MTDLSAYAAILLSAGLLVALFEGLGRESRVARAFASVLCILVTLRYLVWRVLYTTPGNQNVAQHLYARIFLALECATLCSSILVYFFMSRTIDRTPQADLHQLSPLREAPVDVFIATYNESEEILERTLIGALALDHPDLRVWLLDDGARPSVERLARSLGACYVARVKGKHAKAGNINNAMQHALATGRRPQFLLLLDADFIPHRNLLTRVLGLFDDPTVGIVQTPQHFFNSDPVQSNLLLTSVWPDEQRFFFNCLLPSKDAWGAAFCCGTSAVFRVQAFIDSGGMATQTVTEDMLTTFQFLEHEYRTIYLNERLSLGLAPESLQDFLSQRARWCLGAIQQIFTRWSFFGRGRVSFINRIAFFDTVLYWVSGAAFKLLLLSAPLLYWFTGTAVLHASLRDLLSFGAPVVVANLIYMRYLTGNRVMPVMTDITQILISFVILRSVVTGLIRPFGRPFKVTAKGLSTSGITVQWAILWRFAALSLLSLIGVFFHLALFNPARGTEGYAVNLFWSLFNALLLAFAAAACIEPPHRRRTERFLTTESALVCLGDCLAPGQSPDAHASIPCTLQNISVGGAALMRQPGHSQHWRDLAGPAHLVLSSSVDAAPIALPFTVVRREGATLTLTFHPEPWIRHALIRKLFTGAYHHDVETVHAGKVLHSLAHIILD